MTTPGQRGSYAVIPAHNHQDTLIPLVVEMVTQVDLVVVIDNASDPPISHPALFAARMLAHGGEVGAVGRMWLWRDAEQPPNLSRLWNAGLSACAADAKRRGLAEWDVAILNDDAVVPPGWMATVREPMRADGAAAACTYGRGNRVMKTEPDADIGNRLYGPAFVLRGELAAKPGDPLWTDERLRWWFQDTDTDWRARRNGGMLITPGPHVPNLRANQSTVGELAEQAGRDRETFREIWGWVPW